MNSMTENKVRRIVEKHNEQVFEEIHGYIVEEYMTYEDAVDALTYWDLQDEFRDWWGE